MHVLPLDREVPLFACLLLGKEKLLQPSVGRPYDGFESIEDARSWTARFVRWHTYEHQHSAINFVTPEQRHTGAHIDVLKKRHEVYQLAKQKHPERWSKSTRNWSPHESVALNPMKEKLRTDPIK